MSGLLRGVDYDSPIVKYRGERILHTLKKVSGRDTNIDPNFLIDTYYVHYLPLPIPKSKAEIDPSDNIKYSLVDMTMSSEIVNRNRNYSVANSAVSMALSVSYVQNLIEELERIRRTSQSQEEREAAEQILNGIMRGSSGREGRRKETSNRESSYEQTNETGAREGHGQGDGGR